MKYAIMAFLCVLALKLTVHAQTTNTLTAVQFISANTVTAVGNSGTVLRSNDGGVSWSSQSSGTSNNLYSVYFNNSSTGTAVGGNPLFGGGTVEQTVNSGSSWSFQSSGTGNLLLGVWFTDANNGVAVGNNGTIVRTMNGGASWASVNAGTSDHLYEVCFSDANNGYAVGWLGRILHTADGGASWSSQSSGTNYVLYSVSFSSTSTGTIVGDGGTILRTVNGGSSWTSQSSGTTYSLRAVDFVDANTGYAVGLYGTILKTTNGGSSWTTQSSGTFYDFFGVSFSDANTGVAVGYNGLMKRTTNGGATWTDPSGGGGGNPTPPATPTLVSPANGATNQSTTPTLSWNASSGATSYHLQLSTSSLFATTIVDDSTLTGTSRQVSGLAENTTYYWHVSASNSAGTSSYSSTWSFTTSAPPPPSPVFTVNPTSINFGTVSVGKPVTNTVIVTNTGGSTLTISSIVSTSAKYTVSPTSGSLSAGSSMAVNITFTPTNKTSVTAQVKFNHNAVSSPGVVNVTGKGGSSTKGGRTPSLTQTGKPMEYALQQNYPNPFNPTTTISYDVVEPSHVQLSVYTVLGQEVASLVNEDMDAGSYSAMWNSSNTEGLQLSSGIYLYRIHISSLATGQEYTQVRRMMLIK
jgi:photosystem II stability/assembly factor-like uncharacterized protein